MKKFSLLLAFFLTCQFSILFSQLSLDNNGWTILPQPTGGSKKIYVSNSTGNDNNNGLTPATAVKTIEKGYQLLSWSGSNDWLCLKQGDTWFTNGIGVIPGGTETQNDFRKKGRSKYEPIVITSYSDNGNCGVRPKINTGSHGGFRTQDNASNICIVGIEFYAHTRDPQGSYWTGTGGSAGFDIYYSSSNILIEDCKFTYYETNIIDTRYYTENITNIKLRRNIIAQNYSAGAHSQGVFANGSINGLLIEENIFNHNGWNEYVNGAEATMFNHNMYLSDGYDACADVYKMKNVTVKGNIVARGSSHGTQLRNGGRIENNLYLDNSIGLFARRDSCIIRNNCVIDGKDIETNNYPRGYGIEINPSIYALVENNIVAHNNASHTYGIAYSIANSVPKNADCNDNPYTTLNLVNNPKLTFQNNISYNWKGTQLMFSLWESQCGDGAFGLNNWSVASIKNNTFNDHLYNSTILNGIYGSVIPPNHTFQNNSYFSGQAAANWFQMFANCNSGPNNRSFAQWVPFVGETGSTNTASTNFSNPSVNISSYHSSIGGVASLDAFLEEAMKQSKCNWKTEYMAATVNDYIRDGFSPANGSLIATMSAPNHVSCFGGNNGSATVSPSGGTAPYTYAWSNNQNTPTVNGLAAGVYTVTVTDATSQTKVVSVTITAPNAISTQGTVVAATCGQSNGSVNVSVTGGSSPYTYLWNNASASASISNVSSGSYSVTITDNNNCTAQAIYNVTCNATPITLQSSNVQNVSCFGANNGSATIIVSGGVAPYSYSWNNSKTTATINSLSPGNYVVTVTDNAGTTATSSITITQPTAINTNGVINNATCGQNNGSVNVTVSGGSAPYNYLWSNSSASASISNVSTGSYSVTITDNNNCTTQAFYNVTCNATPIILQPSWIQNVSCFGGNNAYVTIGSNGGIPPYTYLWSNGSTGVTASNLSSGIYSVTVTDNLGNTSKANISVSQPNSAISASAAVVPSVCGQNDGAIGLSVSGGTAPYTYAWSNNSVASGLINIPSGNYSVIITDNNNCSIQAAYTVSCSTNNPLSLLSSNIQHVSCFGGNNGLISVNATGGTSPYNYTWSNNQNTPSLNGLTAGIYTLTVTDNTGATATIAITINQPVNALAQNISLTPSTCGQSDGAILLLVSGGTAPYTYLWNNNSVSNNLANVPDGNYTVVITDNNDCSIQAAYTLSCNATNPLTLLSSNVQHVSCFGENNGKAFVTASGGNQPYSYSWSNNQTGPIASGLAAGSYMVVVTDNTGASALNTVVINQPPAISVSSTISAPTCGQYDGAINLNITGGSAPYSILWNTGANTANLTNVTATGYAVLITDNNNCTYHTTFDVSCIAGSTTGISEFSETSYISAYPNPSNGSINIQLNTTNIKNIIEVVNTLGDVVYKTEIQNDKFEINLKELIGSGMYVIRVNSGASLKVIITD